ncbi:MAG: tetraacyldisaccharide 4'-kinase [Candidatus Eutrophobiaceae bacterium]
MPLRHPVEKWLQGVWSQPFHPFSLLLAPLGWLFALVAMLRRHFLPARAAGLSVPVVVVGNLSVGGTGKTPLVIWLVEYLLGKGYSRVGIVSRGYGGNRPSSVPQQVNPDSDPYVFGDEPVLLAMRTGVPVAICVDRRRAAQELIERSDCDIVISDDGLQHFRLPQDLRICLIDPVRGFGNGRCLPAGPLREPLAALREMDIVIGSDHLRGDADSMQIQSEGYLCDLRGDMRSPLAEWQGQRVHAVAGIGNPAAFFLLLRNHGMFPECHSFPDHHRYVADDLRFEEDLPVIMTEKDAVKCRVLALLERSSGYWSLPITAILPDSLVQALDKLLEEKLGAWKSDARQNSG